MTGRERFGFCLLRGIASGVVGSLLGGPFAGVFLASWSNGNGQSVTLETAAVGALFFGFFSLFVTVPASTVLGIATGLPLSRHVREHPALTLALILLAGIGTPLLVVMLIGPNREPGGIRDMVGAMLLTLPFSTVATLAFWAMLWRARARLA